MSGNPPGNAPASTPANPTGQASGDTQSPDSERLRKMRGVMAQSNRGIVEKLQFQIENSVVSKLRGKVKPEHDDGGEKTPPAKILLIVVLFAGLGWYLYTTLMGG